MWWAFYLPVKALKTTCILGRNLLKRILIQGQAVERGLMHNDGKVEFKQKSGIKQIKRHKSMGDHERHLVLSLYCSSAYHPESQ